MAPKSEVGDGHILCPDICFEPGARVCVCVCRAPRHLAVIRLLERSNGH